IDAVASYTYSGRTALALEYTRKAAELDPTFFFPVMQEGTLALLAGNYPEAIAQYERARTMGAPPFTTADLAYVQGISGDRAGAMASLAELRKISPGGEAAPFNLALVYLGLGDYTRAIDYLEQAYAASSQSLVWLNRDAIYDPLRSDPRFIDLMKRLNFVK
ncbi:MAG: tetratricopeptide repeat protein, partial [Gemmatimonadales bacterium]